MDPTRSASAPSLSRSAPSLPLAYNLRLCSKGRRGVAALPTEGAATAVRMSHPLGEIDLVGGNGRWRQKRAKEQWIVDQAEAEKQRVERQILEDEKTRRREEREARRRKQQEEDSQRMRALEDKARRERLAQEERDRQEEEEKRKKAAEEHEDWLARQPKTCTTCVGSGKCTYCGGKGFFFAMFLAPSVGTHETTGDFGRAQQGCPECGGCAQNIRGDLIQGSGRCHKCDGVGMVTPEVVQKQRNSVCRSMTMRHTVSTARRTQHLDMGGSPTNESRRSKSGALSPDHSVRSPSGAQPSPGGRKSRTGERTAGFGMSP